MPDFKDTVKTIMQTNALFTLSTFTFVKFRQCLHLKLPPLVMSRTGAQNALYSIFKAWSHSVRYTTRIL